MTLFLLKKKLGTGGRGLQLTKCDLTTQQQNLSTLLSSIQNYIWLNVAEDCIYKKKGTWTTSPTLFAIFVELLTLSCLNIKIRHLILSVHNRCSYLTGDLDLVWAAVVVVAAAKAACTFRSWWLFADQF